MTSVLPATIQELETPCFLVDIDKVKRNCQRMRDKCEQMGLDLRPHMKTHKTREGGELMTGGTKKKIVVATLDEAVFYADGGFEDILWASPLVKERVSQRLINLANRMAELHVMVDSIQGLAGLISTPLKDGKKWSVFLEIDCGYGRSGCLWDSDTAIEIGTKACAADNVDFKGIYTHCGNSYSPEVKDKNQVQQDTCDRLLELKNRLSAAGVECKNFGCGSTPTCSKPIDSLSALTEMHPGNYIFYDYEQVLANSCTFDDIACKVATTVISHKPENQTVVVDCGWTAFGLDGPFGKRSHWPAALGQAPVEGHPELKMEGMSQEVGKLTGNGVDVDYSKYPLGSRLYLYPWHSCCTATRHPIFYIHSGDKIVGTWKPTLGW